MVKAFCERLKELREERGLTLMKLSEELGGAISHSALGRWEKGDRSPVLDNLIILAKYFGVSIDYLAGLQDY